MCPSAPIRATMLPRGPPHNPRQAPQLTSTPGGSEHHTASVSSVAPCRCLAPACVCKMMRSLLCLHFGCTAATCLSYQCLASPLPPLSLPACLHAQHEGIALLALIARARCSTQSLAHSFATSVAAWHIPECALA
eukprot:1159943-Pelagomonas_calceolata.AAC.1